MIHFVLLTNFPIKLVPDIDFDLAKSGAFENYPWGREVFNVTIESLKKKLATPRADQIDKLKKKEKKFTFYRLNGFPYAFQLWFYECCPFVINNYSVCVGGLTPRMLRWECICSAKFKELRDYLFIHFAETVIHLLL